MRRSTERSPRRMNRFRFGRRKRRGKPATPTVVIDALPPKLESLGCGTFSLDGTITFTANPSKASKFHSGESTTCISSRENFDINELEPYAEEDVKETQRRSLRALLSHETVISEFKRIKSTFLRVADLHLTTRTLAGDSALSNFHHASVDPPPGIAIDPMEQWVALDDGAGSHAPIAPFAVAALARFGLATACDQAMWKAEYKTDRLLKASPSWKALAWQEHGLVSLPCEKEQNDVLVWSGTFMHGLYGSDLPAVRAAGIVNMSAKDLCELLIDSTRVKEYNKLSLGRSDLMVLQGNMEEDGPFGKSITKVVRSESKPPLVRKTMQLVSVLHATELADQSGYLLVTRAVTEPSELDSFDAGLRSEILMGVNVIRKIEGEENRCLMINVNHIRSPMVPMMIARKIGLTAAVNFIAQDLRSICTRKQ